jgi:hypothetical protein
MKRDSRAMGAAFLYFYCIGRGRIGRVESAFALWRELSARWLKHRDSKEITPPPGRC